MKIEITNPAVSLIVDELEARGITRSVACAAMSVPRSRLTDIINGRKRISTDTALRFERFFGVRANLWLGLQQDYELKIARKNDMPAIERQVAAASPFSAA